MLRILIATLFVWSLAGSPLGAQDGTPSFSDQAPAAGVNFLHTNPSFFSNADYTGGGAVGDFDRDGCVDLFGVSGGNTMDHLFINNGNGTFSDKAFDWNMTLVHNGKAATVGDYNDDGWLDIYVTSAGPVGNVAPGYHKLYRNNGNKTFTNAGAFAGVNFSHPTIQDGFGSAFGDYDLDGDLDLFVAGFASNNNGSRLFRNDGDGTFTDVTAAIGFWSGTGISVSAFAPRFMDLDGDAYPELLLVGDFGTSRLFQNDTDGTFTDVTAAENAGQDENGMGQTVGDYNNDGQFDWYVTSIYLPTSGWTGNKLYINNWPLGFNEIGETAGVDDGGYGWGAVSVDFDHDGFQDIAETNGDNGTGTFVNEQSYVWMSEGDGTFTESALALGLNHKLAGRGMVNLDYDDDGDQDVGIFTNFARFSLWRNDLSGNEIAWLRVFLDTTASDELAPDGYGSVVKVTVGGDSQYRFLSGGDNFLSCSELSAHFGLGAATNVDELRVEWSNGDVTVLTNVAVNQTLVVEPPEDDQWTRVGLGIGGSNGVPQLRGAGDLVAGNPTTLTYTSGKPSTQLYAIASQVTIFASFQGGVFVPSPDTIVITSTDANGEWAPTVPWPAGMPPGTNIWFQVWQMDATGLFNWVGSNGLKATTP